MSVAQGPCTPLRYTTECWPWMASVRTLPHCLPMSSGSLKGQPCDPAQGRMPMSRTILFSCRIQTGAQHRESEGNFSCCL